MQVAGGIFLGFLIYSMLKEVDTATEVTSLLMFSTSVKGFLAVLALIVVAWAEKMKTKPKDVG